MDEEEVRRLGPSGLSLDDKPIQPVRAHDKWICPVEGKEVLKKADGSWVHKPGQAFLDAFSISLKQFLEVDS